MTTITQADRDAVNAFHNASFTALFDDGGGLNKAHTLLLEAFAAHRKAAEARAREAQPTDEDLADEIADAISDTLDMDWQPSWAAPNIIAIINRERRLAREEGAKAMRSVEPALYQLRHHQQQADMDGTFVTVSRQALDEVLDAIAALDPAQIAGDGA